METRKRISKKFLLSIVMIVLVFGIYPVFAGDKLVCGIEESSKEVGKIRALIKFIGEMASWVWIVLSNTVGVLMTNTLVYGEALHFDIFLWKIWQITRTFANYTIGFLFVYTIGQYLISSKTIAEIKKQIKKLFISAILVQASWFLMMALVDLSTIGLATVTAFPGQVIATSPDLAQTMAGEICKSDFYNMQSKHIIRPFADSGKKYEKVALRGSERCKEEDINYILDKILPSPNDLQGPLIYLGYTMMEVSDSTPFFQSFEGEIEKYNFTNTQNEPECINRLTRMIIDILFKGGSVILYSFALAILIIVLIMRIVLLWLAIAITPILCLAYMFDFKMEKLFDIKKIFQLVFQPVVWGFWIGLMFLFVVVLKNVFFLANFSEGVTLGGIEITENDKQASNISSDISLGNIVKMTIEQGSRSLKDILLTLCILAMMWQFIKLAAKSETGISFIDNFTGKIVESTEKAFKNMPIIPLPNGQRVGLEQLKNMPQTISSKLNNKISQIRGEQDKRLNEWLGVEEFTLTDQQKEELKQHAENNGKEGFGEKLKKMLNNNTVTLQSLESPIGALLVYGEKGKDTKWNDWGLGNEFQGLLNENKTLQAEWKNKFQTEISKDQQKVFYEKVLGGKNWDDTKNIWDMEI